MSDVDQATEQVGQLDPVIGDGVITLPVERKKLSMDLPEGVGQLMMTETAGNIQASNRNSRNTSDVVMGALQGTVVQNFKDVGVVEGRSVSGILATPIAGPSSAQK